MNEIVIQYSGGTDSTAATVLVAEKYDRIHLITYKHSGLAKVENSARNIEKLKELFGKDKFLHVVMDTDKIYKMVSYSEYLKNIRDHGLFVLSSCGLCHFSMHIRTLIYCLDNSITETADGANKNSDHFPTQMEPVIMEVRKMYKHFGINYSNPVFDCVFPKDLDWKHKFKLPGTEEPPPEGMTTGKICAGKGILEKDNIKGTPTDRKMQPRCFGFTLHNLFSLKYYIPRYGFEEYIAETTNFYKHKVEYFTREIELYLENREKSKLSQVIDK